MPFLSKLHSLYKSCFGTLVTYVQTFNNRHRYCQSYLKERIPNICQKDTIHIFSGFTSTTLNKKWNPWQSSVSFVFFWNFNQTGRIWSSFTLLDSKAIHVALQTRLHHRVCQMSNKTSFQVTDSYFISSKNGLQSYCETSHFRGCVNQMKILKYQIIC